MRSQRPQSADDFGAWSASVNRRWGRDLEDEFLASYVRWREACADVRLAYEHWRGSEPGHGAEPFVVYQAALDREECAALDYSDLSGQLTAGSPAN
jgi:hypothetical protein